MNGHLSSLLAMFTRSPRHTSRALRRQTRLGVECLDGRQLMTAGLAPGNLLIYYGYPSLVNGANGNLTKAASTLGSYNDVVLGDKLELSSHPDHANTVKILASSAMANTKVFGYVDLGVSTQNLSIKTMETDVSDWKTTGATGIFLDDFGYDYDTTRARQNTIVGYAHRLGLAVMANAYNPADAFGASVSANNPTGTPTALNSSDYYLYESYQVELGTYVSAANWQAKATQLATYQASIGFKVAAETTNNAANTFNQSEFNYAWYSALISGYSAVGWGEFNYAASTCVVPSAVPLVNPAPVAIGTSYLGSIVETQTPAGPVFTRNTNLGEIQVNTAGDAGSFTPLPAAPTFTGKAVSPSQITLTWSAVTGATGYVVDELVSGSWKQIASLGSSSLSDPISGLSSGTSYGFKVAASNVAGTVFATPQTVETFTAAPAVTAAAVSTSQINLSWASAPGATGYIVEELIAGAWKPIVTVAGTSNGFSVTALSHGVSYSFRVGAIDAAGTEFSNSVAAKTK